MISKQPEIQNSRGTFAPELHDKIKSIAAAKQMGQLQAMLAQRPTLEAAGVLFEQIANYERAWKIERD